MDQVVTEKKDALSPSRRAADIAAGNLFASQASLVTEDLATFLVAHHILITGNDSIASIKQFFKREPEIFEIVDELLMQLEKADLISVSGDTISIKQRFVDIGGNVENLRRFVPRLFKLAADRVLSDAETGSNKAKKEGIRYFAIPNDAETSAEAQALYLEYKSKMLAIVDKADKQGRTAEGVRLVGIFNCSLVPEDFA